jgi:U3 small nucleolar RNA-associated protein 21
VTAHAGDPVARTWRAATKAAAGVALVPPRGPRGGEPRTASATAVALSRCGNFAIVGYADGRVDRYNMQSGAHRCAYVRRGEAVEGGAATARPPPPPSSPAHSGPVVGVASDAGNTRAVTASEDGFLAVWAFRTGALRGRVALGAPAARLAAAAATPLVGVALSTGALLAVDASRPAIVRRFAAPPDRVSDLALSADGRWLLAASLDGSILVLDVPAGAPLQRLLLGAPVASLSLSPTGDLLATAHAGRRGVCLWSNQAVFGGAGALQPAAGGGDAAVLPPLPAAHAAARAQGAFDSDSGSSSSAGSAGDDLGGESSDDGFAPAGRRRRAEAAAAAARPSRRARTDAPAPPPAHALRLPDGAPAPLAPGLATTSSLPRAQWASLPHLDALKKRNAPTAPPTKPDAAPFFLPTVPGLEGRPMFVAAAEGGSEGAPPLTTTRVARGAAAAPGPLAAALRAGAGAPSGPCRWDAVAAWLRAAPPSTVDRELASLTPLDADDADALADVAHLLAFCGDRSASGADFELTQAFLAAALAAHGETVAGSPALRAAAAKAGARVRAAWARLDDLLHSVRCAAAYAGGLPT